jgi:hypothetical protein
MYIVQACNLCEHFKCIISHYPPTGGRCEITKKWQRSEDNGECENFKLKIFDGELTWSSNDK